MEWSERRVLKRRLILEEDQINVGVEQGYEIGRHSLLHLKAKKDKNGRIDVNVGGKVQLIAKGELI